MHEQTFENIDFTCRTQAGMMDKKMCYVGILSNNGEENDGKVQFLFEETVRKAQTSLNPKLYDGEYLSLVRRKDGRYQIHLKMICPNACTDAKNLSKHIGKELSQALEVVKQ